MIGIGLGNFPAYLGRAKALLALGAFLAGMFLTAANNDVQAKGCFGTALVFAIDASGSINDQEYVLQMSGLSQALRDPEVASAIQSAGGVVLAAVVWSDAAVATNLVRWQPMNRPQDIDNFARTIESLQRTGGGGTDLGQGVWHALDLLEDPSICALRQIVDVSGDGRETLYPRRKHSVSVFAARKRADAIGIVINGLAIVDEEADIEGYYRQNVVTGSGGFVIVANGFEDFGKAMKAKLLREITPVKQAQLNPGWEAKASVE